MFTSDLFIYVFILVQDYRDIYPMEVIRPWKGGGVMVMIVW